MTPLLCLQTYYSLMRGVHSPLALCEHAARAGYTAVALADINNLYGLPEFIDACRRFRLKGVIGAAIEHNDTTALLLCRSREGFAQLCRIITRRHCDASFDLAAALQEDASGLIVATRCAALINRIGPDIDICYELSSLQRMPRSLQARQVPVLVAVHRACRSPADRDILLLLAAIAGNTTLSRVQDADALRGDDCLEPAQALRERFGVFGPALAHTASLIETTDPAIIDGSPVMPPNPYPGQAEETLREKAFAGALWRYGAVHSYVRQRLEYELSLIGDKGFASYFLTVEDIVKQSSRTCGRGSGAASCVAYCMGITNVDPIRYNLMFERFLNPGRTDPPDIDVDFAWDERDAVLDYVFKRYGTDHAALVANHLFFEPRMALRSVGRVYGLTESELSRVTKRFPHVYEAMESGAAIDTVLHRSTKTRGLPLPHPWPAVIADSQRIIGIPFGIGTHCGGVVITPGPLWRYAPVQRSAKGYSLLQWEKDGTETMGLVKIDLLGNRSLAVIRDALAGIRGQGIVLDERAWDPASDPHTVALLAKGDTMGVFYVESPAMRLLQQKTRAGDFDHMVIHSSIIRPAANRYVDQYIRRLHGEPYRPAHPLLSTVLAETFGIMVYQEDVAKVAVALAGFSYAEADTLRKIMSKKDKFRVLEDFKTRFCTGAAKNGVDAVTAGRLWDMCLSFRGYSFCKPHSASYVQVSFQSAYLKAHFPASFLAAVLANYGGFYTTQAYISEAQRRGITVLPPDVNESLEDYTASDAGRWIRVGLCQIKGVSAHARRAIVEQRRAGGGYRSIADLLQRTGMAERDIGYLIRAGAADSLDKEKNRSLLFWQAATWFNAGDAEAAGHTHAHECPALDRHSADTLLAWEYERLGFLTARHPIGLIPVAETAKLAKIRDIPRFPNHTVRFLGWCVTTRSTITIQGDAMQFITFEDETGIVECVLFPDGYVRYIRLLAMQEAFYVTGVVQQEFKTVTVAIKKLEIGKWGRRREI